MEALEDPMEHRAREHLEVHAAITIVLVAGAPAAQVRTRAMLCLASIKWHTATAGSGGYPSEYAKFAIVQLLNQ